MTLEQLVYLAIQSRGLATTRELQDALQQRIDAESTRKAVQRLERRGVIAASGGHCGDRRRWATLWRIAAGTPPSDRRGGRRAIAG